MLELAATALIIVGGIAALATLPGTGELLLLTLGGVLPRRTPPTEKTGALRLAAVVPAHDEEGNIADCVRSLARSEPASVAFQIVVVADNCSDDTATAAERAGARVLVRQNEDLRGKGHALQFAFDQLGAEGFEAFLVIDADTEVEAHAIASIRETLEGGADAVQTRYGVRNPEASMRTRLMNVALMAFNTLRPRGRDRFGLSVGILGNGFALRKSTLERVPYDAHSVVEDLEYHLRLVSAGLAVRFVDDTTVRAEMPAQGKGVDTQRARWEGGRFRMIKEIAPGLARRVLRGEWRSLEPLLELLLLPLAFHVALLGLAIVAPHEGVRTIGLIGLGVTGLHVLSGLVVAGGGWRDYAALAVAPFYVIWKLSLSRAISKASRDDQSWVRTERIARPEGQT